MSEQSPVRRVSLDSASSEPLHPAAREVLTVALDQGFADPRRLHHDGRRARLLLDNAREVVAECLDLRADEVSFTSSGTEAVQRGVLGLHRGARGRGDLLVHSAVEHSSVLHSARWADAPTSVVPVDEQGMVSASTFARHLTTIEGPVAMAAVQSANHEVGTVHEIEGIAEALGGTPLFMDACASVGRLDLPYGWAAAAASAHKWGGPAGLGLLLVRKGARWRNPFPTDDRGDERISGFENVPAALAAAASLRAVLAERDEVNARQHRLIERIRASVASLPDVEVVGSGDDRLPQLVTFSFLYLDGESLVGELDRLGFGVASGSACTSSNLTPSHVLAAMGVLTHGNVRLSLHADTSEDDVERFLAALPGVVTDLRARVGL